MDGNSLAHQKHYKVSIDYGKNLLYSWLKRRRALGDLLRDGGTTGGFGVLVLVHFVESDRNDLTPVALKCNNCDTIVLPHETLNL